MSAISTLDAEIRRVVLEDASLMAEFGDPVRLVETETARSAFPFLRLTRHEIRPQEPVSGGLIEHRISMEMISRAGGREEALRLVALVAERLRTATLAPAGLHVILFYPVYSDVFLRRDGTSFRGLLRLRCLSELGAG